MDFVNNFQQFMLTGSIDPDRPIDLFSRSTLYALETTTPGHVPHSFTQIFEPGVLHECALLAHRDFGTTCGLADVHDGPLRRLRNLYDNRFDLTPAESISVASALVAVSRFDMASKVLDGAQTRLAHNRLLFEADWLMFLITNRCSDGQDSSRHFRSMRDRVARGDIPPSRQLDLCTQVVVWHLKRHEADSSTFEWALARATTLLEDNHDTIDIGAESSWYRGVAMVPAKTGAATETRRLMERARDLAQLGLSSQDNAYGAMNNLKTYWESTLKEHMYVTRDREAALAAASSLIDLDPAWAPSYAERADALRHFGDIGAAFEGYREAAGIGPPYYSYHLKQAADCSEHLGDIRTAHSIYEQLADFAPSDAAVAHAASRLARSMNQAN